MRGGYERSEEWALADGSRKRSLRYLFDGDRHVVSVVSAEGDVVEMECHGDRDGAAAWWRERRAELLARGYLAAGRGRR